jgi:Glucodextranase, domain B
MFKNGTFVRIVTFAVGASIGAGGTADTTSPTITLVTPSDGEVVNASYVRVVGRVQDDLSGAVRSWCNGLPAAIVEGLVTCDVSIAPGHNAVIVEAMDHAGNSGSSGVTVVVPRDSDGLVIAPTRLTLASNEYAVLRVSDASGVVAQPVVNADPRVIAIANVDRWGVHVRGVSAGTTTVTTSTGDRFATATVTVLQGDTLPPGTVRWELPEAGDASIEDMVAGTGLGQVFLLERGLAGDSALRLRGISPDGAELRRERPPFAADERVIGLMGDNAGGVTALVADDGKRGVAIVKFAAAGQFRPWRYRTNGRFVSDMAGGGPLHVAEAVYSGDPAVSVPTRLDILKIEVVNGSLLERHEVRWQESVESSCKNGKPRLTSTPILTGPTVGFDDVVSLLVEVEAACPAASPASDATPSAIVSALGLFRLTPEGRASWVEIWKHVRGQHASSRAGFHPGGIMPFPKDGVLAFDENRALRIQGQSVVELNLMPGATPALIGDQKRLFTAPTVTSVNLETGALDWVAPVQGFAIEALENAGVAVLSEDGRMHVINNKGLVSESARFLPLDDKTSFDDFKGGFNWEDRWWVRRRHGLLALAGPRMATYCCGYHGGLERR